MNGQFKSNSIALALALAFPGFVLPAWAAEPYPALPPTLSTSVPPNVMLHIDNSISMDASVDSKRKLTTAKSVATALVTNNTGLRWGIFSFDKVKNKTTISGVLGAPIGSSTADLTTAINNLGADTYTPLGETLFEITQYFSGGTSFYGKTTSKWNNPIQYRCQKNFAIIITDGDATKDDELPGVKCSTGECSDTATRAKPSYTSYTYNETTKLYSPVTKTFGVCTKAYTDATTAITPGITATGISCPAKLENELLKDSATDHPFLTNDGFGKSYTASLRDVAAYAFDKDFKVGGFDLDGQSFDDQKFIKQNLRTYTVGFGVKNAVLPAAAAVGRGKTYTADPGNEQYLTDALNNAVSDILANSSNAGGVASMGDVTGVGNWIFQPVFNPKDWSGELRCFSSVDSSGNGVSCDPNGKARFPAHTDRQIYSANVTGTPPSTTTTKFDFKSTSLTSMTTAQTTALGTTAAEQTNLINFLRGQEGLSGFRVRPKDASGNTIFLGDIIDAQPVVVAAPIGTSADASYGTFQTANAARSIVFIGANDGMLHAFKIGTPSVSDMSKLVSDMSELMAYVPSAVYPRLQALKEKNYGTSAGTPHKYHVNGTAQSLDVKISGTWETLLTGGLGQGGQGYYAIDATSATTLGTNASIKWEWTDVSDRDMGYSFGKPIIYNVRKDGTTSQPAVILSNGYDNDYADGTIPTSGSKTSALYIVNADTGALIAKLSPPSGGGLSSPAGVDFGQDGVLDYVYAGDMMGRVWRFDLTDADPTKFKVVSTPIFDAGPTHPISYRPSILAVNDSAGTPIGNLVLFGTGKLLIDTDRADATVQSFYAVLDKMEPAPSTVPKSSLLEQTVVDTVVTPAVLADERPGTYRKVSRNEYDSDNTLTFDLTSVTEKKMGWFMDFPVETERLVTSPLLIDDKLIFGTGIPKSNEICLPGGKGWVMGLNPFTGSVVKTARGKGRFGYSFLDIHLDQKATEADRVLFSGVLGYISGYQKSGIPTELSYTSSSQKISNPNTTGTLGKWGSGIAMRNVNYLGVYMANAAADTTKGDSIPVPATSGGGEIYSPVIGQDKVDNDDFNGPPIEGYKLQATTWREIKQ